VIGRRREEAPKLRVSTPAGLRDMSNVFEALRKSPIIVHDSAVLKALLYMLLEQELNLPSLAGYEDPRALMEEVDRGDGGADIRGDSIGPLKTICEGLSRALALKYA
jgi:hypothetical protein